MLAGARRLAITTCEKHGSGVARPKPTSRASAVVALFEGIG